MRIIQKQHFIKKKNYDALTQKNIIIMTFVYSSLWAFKSHAHDYVLEFIFVFTICVLDHNIQDCQSSLEIYNL